MKLVEKAIVAVFACIVAQGLEAQQLSIGVLRETATSEWLDPLAGIELAAALPLLRACVRETEMSAPHDPPAERGIAPRQKTLWGLRPSKSC